MSSYYLGPTEITGHTDEQAAIESIFGGLVASSFHTLCACTRVVVEALGAIAILSGVGLDEVKMFHPVRPGDVLMVEAYWTDLRRSKTKPDRGFASVRCKVTNQKKEPVVEPFKGAHSPLLAAGIATVYKNSQVPCGEDSP